jgi:hypothetical protein
MPRGDGEVEAGAVADAGRKGHAQLMMPELAAAALATVAGLGPCFAAAAAMVAGAADGHFEGDHGADARLARGHPYIGAQRRRALLLEECAPHTIHRGRH